MAAAVRADLLGVGGARRLPERVGELGRAWPEVAPRLLAMLRGRGVDYAAAEDAVQETAARVLATGVGFKGAEDLFPWAAVVCWRLAVDERRRQARLRSVSSVPEAPAPVDIGRQVAERLRVADLLKEVAQLSPADQDALLSVFWSSETASRREAVRRNLRLHRARGRLRRRLGALAPAVAWFGRGSRTLRRARSGRGALYGLAAPALVAGALLVVPALLHQARGPEAPIEHSATAPADRGHPAAHAGVAGPTSSVAVPRRDGATTRPRIRTAARVGTPVAPHSDLVFVRPKQPGDHLVCVSVSPRQQTCLDLPPPFRGR